MKCITCKAEIGSKSKCPYCGTKQQTVQTVLNIRSQEMIKTTSATNVFERNAKGTLEIVARGISSAGTGFLINREGYAVTNEHVVTSGDFVDQNLFITVAGGSVGARVVTTAREMNEDLALLKLNQIPLGAKPLVLGDSDKIKTGDVSYIMGNSLGDGICITQGIISDRSRVIGGHERIMTDTAMNPGNSGGPFFNEDGKVIGVCVSSRITPINEQIDDVRIPADGMKYCIPINKVKTFLKLCRVRYEE